jgi:hypothetical protein
MPVLDSQYGIAGPLDYVADVPTLFTQKELIYISAGIATIDVRSIVDGSSTQNRQTTPMNGSGESVPAQDGTNVPSLKIFRSRGMSSTGSSLEWGPRLRTNGRYALWR